MPCGRASRSGHVHASQSVRVRTPPSHGKAARSAEPYDPWVTDRGHICASARNRGKESESALRSRMGRRRGQQSPTTPERKAQRTHPVLQGSEDAECGRVRSLHGGCGRSTGGARSALCHHVEGMRRSSCPRYHSRCLSEGNYVGLFRHIPTNLHQTIRDSLVRHPSLDPRRPSFVARRPSFTVLVILVVLILAGGRLSSAVSRSAPVERQLSLSAVVVVEV